ncbi:MAG: hypothetical protein HY903_19855 [Deltaproteobacteria bacterium]|nr:hypothetical protein [Deltaproteobacteria bacterium]
MEPGGIKKGMGGVGLEALLRRSAVTPEKPALKTEAPVLQPGLGPLTGAIPTATVTPGAGLNGVVDIMSVDPSGADAYQRELGDRLVTAGAAGYSVPAQQSLVTFLDRQATAADGTARLVTARDDLRFALSGVKADTRLLSECFGRHGLQLLPSDPIPTGKSSLQIDRTEFRSFLRTEAARTAGVIDTKIASGIFHRLGAAVDPQDVDWCKGELKRLEVRGDLTVKSGDAKTARRLTGFLAKLAPEAVGAREFFVTLRDMGKRGFDDASVSAAKDLIVRCNDNDDALFMARRVVRHERKMALAGPDNQSAAARAQIEAAAAELLGELDRKLAGRLDRYDKRQELRSLRRAGKLDSRQFMAMQGALAASRTPEDYAVLSLHAAVALRLMSTQMMLDQAWDDVWKTITENMTDDLRDSQGRIIESVGERELKRMLRAQTLLRDLTRALKKVRMGPKERKALDVRSWANGLTQLVLAHLCGEADSSRRAELVAALNGAEAARVHAGR